MDLTEKEQFPYRVGGLLYTPATNKNIAAKIKNRSIQALTSIVFCLEDSIGDTEVEVAEQNVKKILSDLESTENSPLLFVRVRNPEHLRHMGEYLEGHLDRINGFVLPKFDESNLDQYFKRLSEINQQLSNPKYIMPIIESQSIAKSSERAKKLERLKNSMMDMKDLILNVRVGGNDFSNIYGLRRNVNQNIYQIGVVRDIPIDILNLFSDEYVVSGPVWEYFDNGTDQLWKKGLIRELELDRLNGFIGKTAIHPSQLPLIWNSLQPTVDDFKDAESIVNWTLNEGVSSSADGRRMNEVKTHLKWATKTYILGKIYGVKEELN